MKTIKITLPSNATDAGVLAGRAARALRRLGHSATKSLGHAVTKARSGVATGLYVAASAVDTK